VRAKRRNGWLWIIGLVLTAMPCFSAWAAGKSSARTRDLSGEFHKLVSASSLAGMRVGVWIESLSPNRAVLFEQNGDQLFKPASVMKLITTSAAMTVLPSDFAFRTVLGRQGDNLVVIGAGDPSIGDAKMARAAGQPITALFHRWAEKLKAAGVTAIAGDLVYDDSCFDEQPLHPNWLEQFRGQLQNWWAAPVGGLNFNDNCVDVVIKPGTNVGEPAEVILVPNTPYVQLDNKSKTAAKGEPIVRRLGDGPMTVSIAGPVSRPNSREHPLSLTVVDPGSFFASTLRTVFAIHEIQINGTLRRQRVRLPNGQLPRALQVIDVYETKLSDLLWRVNKSSQNMFAEAIFKSIGFYAPGHHAMRLGSYEAARPIVGRYLEDIGVASSHYVLDDGSGLSRSNRMTPAMMASVLRFMDLHPRRDQWMASLAQPGEKVSTLRRRLKSLQGKVFAKTGHIRGVSSLCGYVRGPGDCLYAFVVLCNDTNKSKGGTRAAHDLQEAICKTLATWEPEPVEIGG